MASNPLRQFEVNPTVYHYCSMESFVSIVKNAELWLSRVDYTNDKYEMKYVNKCVCDIAEELAKDGSISEKQKNNYLSLYSDDDWYDKPFIGCFSERGDILSQWRLYADDAKGVSIGFSVNALVSLNAIEESLSIVQPGYVRYKVEYVDDVKQDCIKKELIERSKEFNGDRITINDVIRFKQNDYGKSDHFKYEEEYRILYQPKQVKLDSTKMRLIAGEDFYRDPRLDYRACNGKLVPYWKMPINGCIAEVILGTKCNANPADLQWFLYKYGFGEIDVKRSKAPYQ